MLVGSRRSSNARNFKFSPDPDQTNTRPKPRKKLVRLELVQVLYGSTFDFNLKLRQNLQIEPYPYSDLFLSDFY